MRPTECMECQVLFIGQPLEDEAIKWVKEHGGRKAQQLTDIRLRPIHREEKHEERGLA